jgi:hypothetical protein
LPVPAVLRSFDLVPVDTADCLAVGEMPPFPPVLLQLRAEADHGEAKAVHSEPRPTSLPRSTVGVSIGDALGRQQVDEKGLS